LTLHKTITITKTYRPGGHIKKIKEKELAGESLLAQPQLISPAQPKTQQKKKNCLPRKGSNFQPPDVPSSGMRNNSQTR
jgi:hypothetical protein